MRPKHPAAHRLLTTGLFDGLISFAELEERVSALPGKKEIGDAFEVFAEAYLATIKISQAREVWPFHSMPRDQRKLLALDTGTDMGVDGTYQTHDDELCAYQVKFRSRRPALTWDELSTFMGLTDQVSQRVLFTNCETLPSVMRDRSGFIAICGRDLDRLTSKDFTAMRQWMQSGQIQRTRKIPLPHQQQALDAISAGLLNNDRATVVMACGTGKTLVALWAAERRACSKVLVLVPSLALVHQLLHEWLTETSWKKLSYLCVCSDLTVAKGVDALIVHRADLDFPVTTKADSVRKFLAKSFEGVKVVFATYHSAHVVAEGMQESFDLGIFDEAHKTASRKEARDSFALDDKCLSIRKRLFFTATPRHYEIRKQGNEEDDSAPVYSMDRPEDYGPVVHKLTFGEAARRGIICNYKVVISVVTSTTINDHLLKHGKVHVDGDEIKARQVASQIALQNAVEKYGVGSIFTFHGTVNAARSFTSENSEGVGRHLAGFKTYHVNGKMLTSEREGHMKAFREASKAVMSNARCLTEGVDVPAVDMVAFMSPRKSKVDIVQATGRAMRASAEKMFGYVMVPLFLKQAANETIEEALKRTDFDDLWDVLSAMKDQDADLVDIIRQMCEDKGRTGGYDDSRFNERIEVLAPSVTLELIRRSITVECLEKLGTTWDERFGELVKYRERTGTSNVSTLDAEYRQLGTWVSTQRDQFKKGRLTQSRVDRLNSIGFIWDTNQVLWEKNYADLVEYKKKSGNCLIPENWLENIGLSRWVQTQRQDMKNYRINPERIQKLDEIGFDWIPVDSRWEKNFAALAHFFRKEGRQNVTEKLPKVRVLQRWGNKLREDRKKGQLSEDRISRLNQLGFVWAPMEKSWDSRYKELVKFKNKNGHCDVRERDDLELAQWATELRKNRRRKVMAKERIALLDVLGFVWDPLKSDWDRMFVALEAYKAKYGNCNVPVTWSENKKLAQWVLGQRKAMKNEEISQEHVVRLETIGFAWVRFDDTWETSFENLVEYKNTNRHCNVPQKWKENPSLGKWVSDQRKKWRAGTLTQERINRLASLGFKWQPK